MPETYAPCQVELYFGDGEYLFKLPLKQITELQFMVKEKTGVESPFGRIYRRVMTGDYYMEDLTETIRLGLIGGGCDSHKANLLVRNYCEDLPRERQWIIARAILSACAQGYENPDDVKKKDAKEKTNKTSTLT